MSIVTIFNQKGGVGKTTTAVNLTAALARRARNPYCIDLDPQAQFSAISGVRACDGDATVLALFQRNRPLRELIVTSNNGGSIIPAHLELSKVDTLFGKGYNVVNRLNAALRAEHFIDEPYPVLIDCSPLIGVMALNAIFACQGVIIPVSADHLSARAALQTEKTLKALEVVLKRRVPRRYLMTRFDSRRRMAWEVQQMLEEKFGSEVCRTRISENVSLAESPAHNMTVFQHAPSSRGAQDYDALLDELLADGFIV
ncbi:chromosome partitioning protein [Janthinobacterium sp. CG_23.3]|uniref:ParA family protein n=1 Tax=unclassified Janthinobacterium TaxID=2610881 RepID=UPI000344B0E8|nr:MULTISPECIES: ParA family protein [unclassified Janthinobacterium]MEC5160655.1 chromosome partitioning protein [Janthinobacterium sp. CG_S6]